MTTATMNRTRASIRRATRLPVSHSNVDTLSAIAGGDPDRADDLNAPKLAVVYVPRDGRAEIIGWDPPCDLWPVGMAQEVKP